MAKCKPILFLLTLALVAASTSRAFAAGWNDDLQQRQKAMEEAVHVIYNYDHEHDAPETLQRAMGVVNGEIALLHPIFDAVRKKPERTAADVRAKDVAHAAARELLARHFEQLQPGSPVTMEEL